MVGQHDETGQVVAFGSQGVADPGACTGETGPLEPGGLQQGRLAMNTGLANHRVDEGHLVGTTAQGPYGVAEHLAALTVGAKRERGSHPGAKAVLKGFDVFSEVRVLSVVLFECRFVIPGVHMAGTAINEEPDH